MLNVKKSEYLTTVVNEHGFVMISNTELSLVTFFKYIFCIAHDGIVQGECTQKECSLALVDWGTRRCLTPQIKEQNSHLPSHVRF
ncbi:unnamed protein product [Heligmosomoides polygyrus]|uniref:Uncharacterized protein n=1 Tax=Heligmosomoides polygyrus TaxID=6339 RepID=A0A183GQ38_HELPZ|nr:unnamed protein product [Heligmosomoides polygyrus]